ncbi:MAG: nickel-responsive regulator [Caldithrix sp. RBG_13_44_9]|nr:MAG: nickel-responsive regulator [Caldithrix sp. RBG_13_44_9]
MSLIRFGVSIPVTLIKKFDLLIRRKNYSNRSEAIRDLIRKELVEEEIEENGDAVGVLHILYNHHRRELSEKLTDIQHKHHNLILSAMHIHLDHDNCIEVIVMQGESQKLKSLADLLIAAKGVKHGKLNLTSTGKYLV